MQATSAQETFWLYVLLFVKTAKKVKLKLDKIIEEIHQKYLKHRLSPPKNALDILP